MIDEKEISSGILEILASVHLIINASVGFKLGWGLVSRCINWSTPRSPVLPVGRRTSAPPPSWTAPSNQLRSSAASSFLILLILPSLHHSNKCMAEDISDKMLTFTTS
ncbi:hypothetical protein GOODEAATRI_027895 [Goodea atripinnis]|uniref:Uncharacterized protein n=1 Tax=Goodea atripinnis TaxID=208336 RepID=A0ABV0N4V4_9TELE